MTFDLLSHPIIFENPAWLTMHTAWSEHIPFAFLLTKLHQPRTFIELGTHAGDSYCAFCQAIARIKLPTRCVAVDTWKGDAHSGNYGEAIYNQLQAHHDPRYGRFSKLFRSDFDSALSTVADGSIDLLHIDGLHTYEAVKHDFETWLPKMSDRGLILFHDTAVKTGDFGVHKLFAEVSANRLAFEFMHGFGLGILATGSNLPPQTAAFLQAARSNPALYLAFFSAVGGRLGEARLRAALVDQIQRIHNAVTNWRRQNGLPIPEGAGSPQFVSADTARGLKSLWDQLQMTYDEYGQLKNHAPPKSTVEADPNCPH